MGAPHGTKHFKLGDRKTSHRAKQDKPDKPAHRQRGTASACGKRCSGHRPAAAGSIRFADIRNTEKQRFHSPVGALLFLLPSRTRSKPLDKHLKRPKRHAFGMAYIPGQDRADTDRGSARSSAKMAHIPAGHENTVPAPCRRAQKNAACIRTPHYLFPVNNLSLNVLLRKDIHPHMFRTQCTCQD